ncbi:MAG: AraC family transcriptional regulator [Erysipelotrichaceae bacterium]|nr:AraC family transcriptional regulator [Erysipelotrichaceae bacterium]MDY5251605.1 AraC family transcriptional regulator [Erysipelotrichaceae bacterium]
MGNYRYNINSSSNKPNVSLLYITHAQYDTDWNSKIHTHHCTEIFYVTKGGGKFTVENEVFDVKEDDLIIVNPLVSHTEHGIKGMTLEYIVVGINGIEFFNVGSSNNGYTISNYKEYKHEVLFYLKTLLIEASNREEQYEIICQNLLEILIINLVRRSKVAIETAKTSYTNKECEFLEKYINDHFKENITLEELSDITFVNKYHLVHSFTKFKGISPIQYVIKKRIEEAIMLLTTTDLSIQEIADVVGFSSCSYFTQAFKKSTNLSPIQYRKTYNDKKLD